MCSKPIFCSKIARKGKTFSRLLEPQKVAPNAKSCSKVAEHNRDRPTSNQSRASDCVIGCYFTKITENDKNSNSYSQINSRGGRTYESLGKIRDDENDEISTSCRTHESSNWQIRNYQIF